MKFAIVYFVSSFLKAAKVFFLFYRDIFVNVWNLPKHYDLSDTTLMIRTIKYSATSIGIIYAFAELAVLISERPRAELMQQPELDYLFILLNTYVGFVVGACVVYFANKIYPQKKVSFHQCLQLEILLAMICTPIYFVISVLFPVEYSEFGGYTGWLGVNALMALSLVVIVFRNTVLLLQLKKAEAVGFVIWIIILGNLARFLIFPIIESMFTSLPEHVRKFLERMAAVF